MKPLIIGDDQPVIRAHVIVQRLRDGEPAADVARSIGYHPAALYRRLHQLGYSGARKRR